MLMIGFQNPPTESHVGWLLDAKAHTERRRNENSVSESVGSVGSFGSSIGTPQSLPTFHHPSHALLKDEGFTQLQYSKYHSRCLKGQQLTIYKHTFNYDVEFRVPVIETI